MRFFNFHTHIATNQDAVLELVNQYPQDFQDNSPFYSIGIHPWYINKKRINSDLKIIEDKIQNANCLALGECGLDKRVETSLDLQLIVFEQQLALAEKYQKPVLIHCVAAFQELIAIKKRLQITVPMIVHGFSKNEQLAKQLVDNGFYISFGKYLLQNPNLEAAFKSMPDDRFFLETDTLSDGIEKVYSLAAQYKNTSLEELKQIINTNFTKVFKTEL